MFAKLLQPVSGRKTALWFFVLPLRTFQLKEKSNVPFVVSGCDGKRAILHSTSYN